MRRNQQFSVSCRPSDWEEIGRRAKEAGMPISRFVVACALEDEDDMRLALSEAEQRDLLKLRHARVATYSSLVSVDRKRTCTCQPPARRWSRPRGPPPSRGQPARP